LLLHAEKIDNLLLPEYYPEYSSEKIITMDWMEGVHLSQFKNSDPIVADKLVKRWDFYMYQIHILRKVHADPHPEFFSSNKKRVT
jgi:predicted unusual protein kinase regulating ubiquinone biosynthesis (AarF/ABC1/UbiB family)